MSLKEKALISIFFVSSSGNHYWQINISKKTTIFSTLVYKFKLYFSNAITIFVGYLRLKSSKGQLLVDLLPCAIAIVRTMISTVRPYSVTLKFLGKSQSFPQLVGSSPQTIYSLFRLGKCRIKATLPICEMHFFLLPKETRAQSLAGILQHRVRQANKDYQK